MDSSRKRTAQALNATPSASEGSATKKLKLLNSNPKPSAERSVQAIGNKLIAQLNNATDKTGRPITDAFVELPPKDELPDYYQVIRLPISISMIEEKLQTNAYATVSALESDFKRMIQNAKDYNEPKSEIYEDAERIRKLIYNYMKINNPAYSDSNYSAVATPIPGLTKITLTNGSHHPQAVQPPPTKAAPTPKPVKDERPAKEDSSGFRISLGPRGSDKVAEKASEPPSDRKSSVAPSVADGGEDESMDFTGKTFQQAQEMIIAEMIRYTDEEGLEIFTPFVFLPSRSLVDYYRYIKHPVSLKSVQKRVRGQHGRNAPTGISDFKTWDTFEQEVSFIWRNARDYNEDGSDMYALAGDLEEHFKSRLAEAKELVKEPQSTRIKLGGPQPQTKSGVTLSLSQSRPSPSPSMTVDNDALARQRNLVQAGVNGSSSAPQPQPDVRPVPAANGIVRQPSQGTIRPPSAGLAGSPPLQTVKNEKMATLSPAPHATAPAVQQPTTNGMMPPPMVRAPSGTSNQAQPTLPVNSFSYTAPSLLPPTAIRQYPASEALLPLVTLHTHPQLKVAKPFSMSVTPHLSLSHNSTTVTIPATHFFLQIQPTISRELALNRAYKIFVTMNGTRLTQRDTSYHQETGKRTHSYDGNLAHGVNRIEIEVAAAKAGDNGDGKGLDIEKVTVFAHLTRA
ncbi:putative bromodomain-containing protein [Septoria linicola]|nr:putative bromodomain-containing protein [Septoria linicola]